VTRVADIFPVLVDVDPRRHRVVDLVYFCRPPADEPLASASA
jgi:hypothetical protein